jgi:hypothetical protein
MTNPKDLKAAPVKPGRRALLTGAGLGAAAAAVAPLLPAPAEAYHVPPDQRAPRYKDSAHNQRFYALNRQ